MLIPAHQYKRKLDKMKLKSILLGGVLFSGLLLSACGTVTNSLAALWESDCNAKTRYQTPTDRPYITREVTVQGGAPDVMLAGELTMPNGPGPFPGAVLISGSELADRDSFILGHKPFLVLADYLTRRGYAVYRHDDRGYGESTGDSVAAVDADFSADAAAALKWLRTQEGIDASRVGFIGHSQGGFKGPLAARIEKPDFMIFLASGVESIGGLLLRQSYDIAKASGVSDEDLAQMELDLRKVFEFIRLSETAEEARTRIMQYGIKQGSSKKQLEQLAANYTTPWMMNEIKSPDDLYAEVDAEVGELIKAYNGPILAIYGGKDLLVAADFNAPRTGPLLTNPQSEVVVFPNMNHFMQSVPTKQKKRNAIIEVCDIDMTFSPKALDAISTWLDKVTK